MRIACPYCGTREASEFSYLGDAGPRRPDPGGQGADTAFFEYAYLRRNPAGLHCELWYHAAGCHSWLDVERDTRTHEIHAVRYAQKRAP